MSSVCTGKPRRDEEGEREMDIYILILAARHDRRIHYLLTFYEDVNILVNTKQSERGARGAKREHERKRGKMVRMMQWNGWNDWISALDFE